ncbi:PREDICTED: zymogen granule protein 16 homolog B [Galeopterus variegatus]|nr:PREDICTED: zymogen granule protein 16 homolog B [Galeopterus variegatus]
MQGSRYTGRPSALSLPEPGTRRPEAMLLLLTLALLGTNSCWAAQLYGNRGGTYFSTSEDYEYEITGIRVSTGGLGLIKSVQVKFGPFWDDVRGASGGDTQEFLLWSDEYITEAYGSFKAFLRYLVLCTNLGRCVSFGKDAGKTFSAFPSQEGQVLTGIFGQYGLLGIKGIGFKWDYPPVESTPTPTNVTSK